MTIPDQAEIDHAQRDVQRLLGRCLLRIQQYESLLKSMIAMRKFAGTPETITDDISFRRKKIDRDTLGVLVNRLMGGYIMKAGVDTEDEPSGRDSDVCHFSFRLQLGLPDESYDTLKADLHELVQLRNNLVHHFIEQHDLWTINGCLDAQHSLRRSYAEVDRHFERLHAIALGMNEARNLLAETIQSQQFEEMLVNGIGPDGQINWSMAGIVYTLRRACQELAIDGWVNLDDAVQWATHHEPEQTPKKYGCARWRHVIHKSGQFELRRFMHKGRSGTWFRTRQSTAD